MNVLQHPNKGTKVQITRLRKRYQRLFHHPAVEVHARPEDVEAVAALTDLPVVPRTHILPGYTGVAGTKPESPDEILHRLRTARPDPGACERCGGRKMQTRPVRILSDGARSYTFQCRACQHIWTLHVNLNGSVRRAGVGTDEQIARGKQRRRKKRRAA